MFEVCRLDDGEDTTVTVNVEVDARGDHEFISSMTP